MRRPCVLLLQLVRMALLLDTLLVSITVPVITLYRRVNGIVAMGSRPGPAPVLSLMEDRLAHYLVEMADMGFGLSRQEVMCLAFQIAEESGIKHPFKNCTAGRKWFEAFRF